MKYDYLRKIPVNERPKMIASWEKGFFANKKHLTWLLIFTLPGLFSAAWNGFILSRWAWASFGFVGTEFMIITGFAALCSGMSSSNWGTYFRDLEPFNFWLDMMFFAGGYILVMIGMWVGP